MGRSGASSRGEGVVNREWKTRYVVTIIAPTRIAKSRWEVRFGPQEKLFIRPVADSQGRQIACRCLRRKRMGVTPAVRRGFRLGWLVGLRCRRPHIHSADGDRRVSLRHRRFPAARLFCIETETNARRHSARPRPTPPAALLVSRRASNALRVIRPCDILFTAKDDLGPVLWSKC